MLLVSASKLFPVVPHTYVRTYIRTLVGCTLRAFRLQKVGLSLSCVHALFTNCVRVRALHVCSRLDNTFSVVP